MFLYEMMALLYGLYRNDGNLVLNRNVVGILV